MCVAGQICCWDHHCQASTFVERFATSLKNKRHEFSVLDLIRTLDFEEKVRAKDTCARVAEGASSAHMVQEKNI